MFAQPFWGTAPKNTFLLNPKNQDFLNGGERKFKDFSLSLQIVLLFIILLVGGIGGGMGYTGLNEITVRSELQQSGIDARATVIDTDYTTSHSKNGTSYSYYMTYEYFVRVGNEDNSTRYTNRQQISSDNYLTFNAGSKITVRYLLNNPSISRFMNDNADDGIPLAVIGSAFTAGGLLTVYFILRQRSRNRRLENEGQLIIGKITKAGGSRVKGGFQVSIAYTFLSPDGAELTRKESLVRNDLNSALLPKENTPVAVIYVHDRLFRIL